MDLFYAEKSVDKQLKKLKKEVKQFLYKDEIVDNKFRIIGGNTSHIGNCVLFLLENVTKYGFLSAYWEKELARLCIEHGIINRTATYAHLKKSECTTRNEIISCRSFIYLLIDIIMPKLIVVMGENPTVTFFNRKFLISRDHGKIIGNHNNIPIVLTFDLKDKEQWNVSKEYKKELIKNDWLFIKNKYQEVINAVI